MASSLDGDPYQALKGAYNGGRVVFYTDEHILARPGSPVYNALDVFVPPLVLMASSLTLLFAFGLIEWIVALTLVLLYQVYGAPRVVHWRVQRRVVEAILRNPHNLQVLWEVGGMAIALKDWPERNCIAPHGDWRRFAIEFLADPPDGQG